MIDPKLHIAGPVIEGIQRCTRCHVVLNCGFPYKDGGKATAWREGRTIYSDGRGNMHVIHEVMDIPGCWRGHEKARLCGRK